ncbi:hypothetical protein D1871_02095 [Nakamurella silvestris]|nr:hypothetical protein D1871_02095 [Nakamurella silvestris]
MTPVLLAGLAGLALLDSTSIGTLIIPVWFLLAPRPPAARVYLRYLAVISAFYYLVGLSLLFLFRAGAEAFGDWFRRPPFLWAQLAAGVLLFLWSFRFDSKKRREAGEESRTSKLRDRVLHADGAVRGTTVLALGAGALELPTMLPYLAGIGLLTAQGVSPAVSALALFGYCLVMVVPALALLGLRRVLHQRLEGPLVSLDRVMSRYTDTALGWVLGVVGFLIARDAAFILF